MTDKKKIMPEKVVLSDFERNKRPAYFPKHDTQFDIYSVERMRYETSRFLEVSRRSMTSKQYGDTRDVISISRGWMYDKEPRYNKTVTFPDDVELIQFVIDELQKCLDRNKF